jgi:hypothetical protein
MALTLCVILILVTQLSESNRQYVAATESPVDDDDTKDTSSPTVAEPLVKKAIDGLSSVGDVLTQDGERAAASELKPDAPVTVVFVRLSKRYLAGNVERAVDRRKPVRDLILGTTIRGESHTTGKTRLILYPNDRQALGEVEFVGDVHAKTVGRNGRATLQYLSDSTFRARKRIIVDESGLKALPAVADAPTRLTATSIRVSLPGLRGLIGQRIAWRRVASSLAQADAIASDHTARDIRHDLDRKTNESIAAIQARVQTQLAALKLDDAQRPMLMQSRSTPDYIEVALCRRGTNGEKALMPDFEIAANPDIAVRVHRTILAQVLSNPQLREHIAPLMNGGSVNSVPQGADLSSGEGPPLNFAKLAMGGEWLVFDFTKSQEPSPRVALEPQAQTIR